MAANSMREGMQALLQLSGLGKLEPNIILLGFKHDWKTSSQAVIGEYFQLLHEAFDCEVGVGVLKVGSGLDFSAEMLEHNIGDTKRLSLPDPDQLPASYLPPSLGFQHESVLGVLHEESEDKESNQESSIGSRSLNDFQMDGSLDSMSNAPYGPSLPPHCPASLAFPDPVAKAFSPSDSGRFSYSIRQYSMMQKEVLAHINQFRRKLKNPEIHVYWLADDGGS
uniref:SLC12A transporter C-terminal domain-containing protein n=1 Tax=Romanomermis culicivorax TaxID=13658 RepID=A0A915K8B5_ROMCU